MSEVDKLLDDHEKRQGQNKSTGQPAPAPQARTAVDDLVDSGPDTHVGLGRSIGDTAVSVGASALTGVQLLTNVAGADNPVSQGLGQASEYVRGFESEGRREERGARARKIEEAEQSGSTMREIGANLGAFAEAPIDTTVEAVGTSLPTLLATALTRGRGGVSVPATMGAAQGAGAVKGAIYEQVEQEYLKAGASPEEAAERAAQAQAYSSDNAGQIAIGAGLGAVAGSTGMESAVGRILGRKAGETAARGVAGSALRGAATEAPFEALQGGQERLAGNIATQNEGFDTPTWQGVAGAAALEGVAGGAAGGGFGALEGFTGRQPTVDPLADAPADAPTGGDPAPDAPQAGPGMTPSPVPEQYRRETLGPDSVAQAVAGAPAQDPAPLREPLPSEQMGINPSTGPLSTAAAIAVDTGTSQQMAQQAALAEAAEIAQQQQKGGKSKAPEQPSLALGEQIDPNTGEIVTASPVDRATELQERISYVQQQARANGWDKNLVDARTAAETELATLQPVDSPPTIDDAPPMGEPASVQEGIQQVRQRRQGEPEESATAPAAEESAADIQTITRKQIPQMTDAEIEQAITHYGPEHKRTPKLQRELAKRSPAQPEATSATTTQDIGEQGQSQTGAQTDPQAAQPDTSAAGAAAPAAEAAPAVDPGARWDAMTAAERKAVADRSGAKPVFAKNLPNANWDRIGANVRDQLVAAMEEDTAESPAVSWRRATPEQAAEISRLGRVPERYQHSDYDSMPEHIQRRVNSGIRQLEASPIAGQLTATTDADQQSAGAQPEQPRTEAAAQIDTAANEAATSPQSSRPEPTEAQKEAGNYAKGHVRVQGLDVTVENPRGSDRSGTDPDGNEWRHTMSDHYGYIKRTTGADGEQVDAYIGPNPESQQVFIVDQVDQQTDGFDEHKVMVGFDSEAEATAAYRSNFDEGWKVGPVRAMSMDEFKGWLKDGDTTKPAAAPEQVLPATEAAADPWHASMEQALQAVPSDHPMRRKWQAIAKNGLKQESERASTLAEVRAAGQAAATPATPAAPDAEAAAKDADRFASNKLFTADKVAAARARMKSKFGQLNSGIDPEMLVDGMTIAGAYIESGVRNFTQYAQAMVEDLGDGVKPYLLSFLEGARNYPGLDTKDMTGPDESRRQFEALVTPEQGKEIAPEAVGEVAAKPKARTRKSGARGDMVLTQDWGVEHIDGYGDSVQEIGNDTKDAFLKESRNYLNAVADALRAHGYEPHLDRKSKPEKPVSVNEAGPAGSGDITLTMTNPDNGNNVYIHIGDTSLRGVVPSTQSGIAVMYRVDPGTDRYATKADNTWAPVDLSANELAALVSNKARPAQNEARNEQPADGAANQGGAQEVRGGRGAAQPSPAQADTGDVAAGQPEDGRAADQAGDSGRPGVREPRADVAAGGTVPEGRNADDGRARAGGARVSDAGARDSGAAGAENTAGSRVGNTAPVTSPAATSVQAQDLHIDNPLEVVGGTPVQRFNRNKQALELLQSLEEDGRQATPEEQRILAGYIGWGSFGQELFQGTWDRPVYRDEGIWKQRGEWLRETLGESAWKSAQRSITNAHYTDPPTVTAMWDMVRRMGFTGGKVLEPSLGTGNFFSMMPADIKARSQLTGIELDETTGAIAKQLFPKSNVRIMGYEKSQTPDGFYDLVIGNWPFENTPIADRRYNKLNPMLHDYFFLKTLDQVRPGGIVIGITSAGSMDKQNTMIRRELARSADLVASIRLPSGAFEEYAGTKVVTDIVILRKRPERLVAVPKDATWVETGEFQTPSGEKIQVNQHYLDNPQSIIGELDFGSGTTTFRAGMIVRRPDNMAERLQQAVELVPENAMRPREQADRLTYYANETGERHGALSLVNDRLMIAMGDQLVLASDQLKYELKSAKATADREKQLRDAVDLRKLHSALADAERSGNDAEPARRALSKGYKAFVKDHGRLRDSFALTYMRRVEDPFFAELAALENDDGTPAAVMRHSTTRSRREISNPNVRDAYVLARNQSVNPSLDEVAKIARKPVAEVRNELLGSGAVFEAPNGDIVPSDIYLSGNVREKMREAEAGLAEGNAAMQANIDALQEVMPEDVPYFNIETKLGATWVSPEGYKQYIAHMLSRPDTKGIEVSFQSGRWKVRLDHNLNSLTEASANYGTERYSFSRLVQAAMSNQVLRLRSRDSDGNEYYDAEKTEEVMSRVAKIREDFGTWLWSDPERRVEMEREYNESRNAWATPTYDGSFLTFEGMALTLGRGEFNLREHQANAIWRAIVNRRSLNAHEVGTGKTFTMGGIAIESRRYGIAKKPVILAHNANSAAVAQEIRMMYPSARVLYIDNLEPKNRDIRLRQIANDDWDAIVIPHSLIDRLSLREETLMQMAADDIAALESEFYEAAAEDGLSVTDLDLDDDEAVGKLRSVTAKELAKARKRIIENIKKQAQQSSRAGAIAFEDLGIDMVLVDEVHEFKKPPIVTRMQMKGLNTQVSGRSIALQFLTRYVRQMNNGGNVHTFTGTPITNTITEIYHQMRYVMESEMEQADVADWDGWFGSFATEVQDVELSAAGDYEMVTRLAGFVNVPELRQMVGQYMDTVFAEDMPEMQPRKTKNGKQLSDEGLTEAERAELLNGRTEGAQDRPYKKVVNATADMTAQQQMVFSQLQGYAQDWRNASGKERRELMRTGDPRSPIVTEGIANKASFDVRLLDETLAGMEGKTNDDPNSKASRVVANTLEIYNSHPQAGQVIFAEMGFSKSVRRTRSDGEGGKTSETVKVFSTVHDIVERLVQGGIPRAEIAVVDGKVNKVRRREIAEAMNDGTMRVVIGSTDTLGVGVNMQRNLRAMHHMDAPYMPGELEQRNGRGQRQGNQWNTVMEYRYMTDRLDGRRWQILAVKQRFITAFMKADAKAARVIEGEAAADEQSDILESFSEAAGDPRVLQRVKIQKKMESLQRKERMYTQGIADMRRQIRYSENQVADITKQIDRIDVEAVTGLIQSQRDQFTATIDGATYDARKDAIAALEDYLTDNMRMGEKKRHIGTYGGRPLLVEWLGISDTPTTTVEVGGEEFSGKGIAGVEASMRNLPKRVEAMHQDRDAAKATAENMRTAMQQPFGQAADLERATKQLADLEQDLEMNPVPPPAWLRQGAPIDSEVYRNKKPYIVTGHRYSAEGWFVVAEDDKGTTMIPYMQATDNVGMPVYDEREFVAPVVMTKDNAQELTDADKVPESDTPKFSRSSRQINSVPFKRWFGGSKVVDENGDPLRVYHGTSGDFSAFLPGAYFTEHPAEAAAYTGAGATMARGRMTGKYQAGRDGGTSDGAEVRYAYDGLDELESPKPGEIVATDDLAYRYEGGGKWTVFTDLEPDFSTDATSDDNVILRKGDAENQAAERIAEYEEAVVMATPNGEGGGNVMPVYLSIKNPIRLGALAGNRLAAKAGNDRAYIAEQIAKWEAQGYDGIVTESDEASIIPESREGLGGVPQQWVAFRPEQIKSAIGNDGNFDPANPDIRRSFAGRRSLTAQPMALETAQLRIAGGDNAETVRQETGWHRGNDGKWRYEISDDQATLAVPGQTFGDVFANAYANAFADGRKQVTVADVLHHDALFAAYPALADIPVSEMPAGERALARLQRRATGMAIQIQPGMAARRVASALLHELQHGIQTIEGFARGGSARNLVSDMDRTGAQTYRRLAGEVEARNTQARQRMTDRHRQRISPDVTADVASADVIVTFNGADMTNGPLPGNADTRPAMTQGQVVRAFQVQFPKLVPGVRAMLARGADGKRGGLVLVDSADPLMIARAFSKKTGQPLTDTVQMFSEAGSVNGFYDPKSGLTFLVTPNLDAVTAPAVLLHEMIHGQQRQRIDRRAVEMLMNRGSVRNPDMRAFLDRVADRMIDAGEGSNESEAAAYIVEQAVIEGRSQGYAMADSRFLGWVDKAFGQRVGDLIRSFLGNVRSWMLRNGMKPGEITVDDLVGYAMAGVERAADGRVDGAAGFSQDAITSTPAFKRWFGDSKIVDADGKPLVVYHGTGSDFSVFSDEFMGESTGVGDWGEGFYFTNRPDVASSFAEDAYGDNPSVMPVYLSINNPATNEILMSDRVQSVMDDDMGFESLRDVLTDLGYDGIAWDHKVGGAGVEYVAFRPEQIKSAIGNDGNFDPSNPDIRFSRSGVTDRAKAVSDAIKSVTVTDVKASAKGKMTDWLGMGLQTLGRRQLLDLYDKRLLPMAKYGKLVERMDAEKNDTGAKSDELARRWGKLKDSAALADLMHDATLGRIDADSAIEIKGDEDRGDAQALKDRFDQLSPEAKAIYREARDTYKDHHKEVIEAIKQRVERSEMKSERKAELLKQMDSEFYKQVKGVYFPLARFGNYVVAVTGPDGKTASVHRAETMGEANKLREHLAKRFPAGQGYEIGKVTLGKEYIASRDSVGRGFMTELYGALDDMNLPSSQLAELEDTLGQLYLASLPDLSWARHGIHRKGTPGFSDDARRAFAQNMFHGARYLAKLRYGDRMQDELDAMQKYADERKQDPDYDQPKAQRVIDEMVKRHDSMMNPDSNPIATALTSFGFVYYLGLSPAAAAVNLSQTALVAYPVMGAKWGFRKSADALMKASAQAVKGKNDITASLSDEERKAYERAVSDGTIDVTMAHDLAGIAQGEDAKVMWKIRPVMRAASFMFHQAEVFNRQVTFMASYRLAREAGESAHKAYESAKKATYDGHFDYGAANRPRIMQGNVARVVLLFKQYAQNMMYTIARNAYQSVAGESPAVRKEARKVFGAIMGLHASAAGVLGLPLVGPLLALASALGGDDDEPWDAEVAMRNMLADALGQKPAEVIARGFSRLGPADISGRVNLNNLLLPDVYEGLEGRRLAEAWTSALLGPVVGMGTNAAIGMQNISNGDYTRGLESMLPLAVRNPIKAARFAMEGNVDRTGIVINDEVSWAGVGSQAIGFSPSEVRLAFEGRSAVFQADRRLGQRRSELMTKFARASMSGDQDGMRRAREEIAGFNQTNPSRRIQANHLMQSVRNRQRRINQAEDGIYLPRNRRDVSDQGRFAGG